jgi:putative methionine-R-sulfoxide reductase with GAF domain/uncharacterized protein YndB with AHSA1/START domain
MSSTRVSYHIDAPRSLVYRALLDQRAVARWMVPTGMTSHVHAFDAREGGSFRISLTYDEPTGTGKTTAHTDTYHGRFVRLIPDEQVVETVEFETTDPGMQGEMLITISLADADGGTDLLAVHDRLPPSLSERDNELGWRQSLAKLAALVQSSHESELPGVVAELRSIAAARGEREEKARRAAAAIQRAGGYRWVGLYDVGAAEIGVIAWAGPSAPSYPTFPRSQGLNGAAVASGEPVIVQDVSRDSRYLTTLGSTRAEMIMPVRATPDGAIVGTIDVESDRANPFTDRDRVLLGACAAALSGLWSGTS